MRLLNGVCFLLAVLLVLGYLVAHPHLGTVWPLQTREIKPTTTTKSVETWEEAGKVHTATMHVYCVGGCR